MIELALIEQTNQTRIKISKVEWERNHWLKEAFKNMQPEKESSRYIYFVVDGDYLNRNK